MVDKSMSNFSSIQFSSIQFTVQGLSQSTRLDRILRATYPLWGRNAIQQLIMQRNVQVNDRVVWLASWEVQNGDRVSISAIPPDKTVAPSTFDLAWLLSDDGEIMAINKPAGLLSEPTRWGTGDNLRDLAVIHFGQIVLFHRLDRDTSGVLLLTRPGPINQWLNQQFHEHTIQKEYRAVVYTPNRLATSGVIDLRLDAHHQRRDQMQVVEKGGQRAITHYEVIETTQHYQQVRLWPQTGRTHQLRVHLAHLGAPILGDRLYGDAKSAERLMLHAHKLTLPAISPASSENEKAERTFVAPLPLEFERLCIG